MKHSHPAYANDSLFRYGLTTTSSMHSNCESLAHDHCVYTAFPTSFSFEKKQPGFDFSTRGPHMAFEHKIVSVRAGCLAPNAKLHRNIPECTEIEILMNVPCKIKNCTEKTMIAPKRAAPCILWSSRRKSWKILEHDIKESED